MTDVPGKEQAINVQDLLLIKGKVALVTGGSRGIGLMIARGYVEAGAKVYISSRKKDVCNRVAEGLSASRAGSYVNGTVIPVDGGICIT